MFASNAQLLTILGVMILLQVGVVLVILSQIQDLFAKIGSSEALIVGRLSRMHQMLSDRIDEAEKNGGFAPPPKRRTPARKGHAKPKPKKTTVTRAPKPTS